MKLILECLFRYSRYLTKINISTQRKLMCPCQPRFIPFAFLVTKGPTSCPIPCRSPKPVAAIANPQYLHPAGSPPSRPTASHNGISHSTITPSADKLHTHDWCPLFPRSFALTRVHVPANIFKLFTQFLANAGCGAIGILLVNGRAENICVCVRGINRKRTRLGLAIMYILDVKS